VPLLREGMAIGVFNLTHAEMNPFTNKQIELVQTFADQAVIAIENARLLNELRESLQQQTATADVLKVISRSTFDLQAVLDTLVQSAARLCEADGVMIGRPKGETYYFEATYGISRQLAEFLAHNPARIDRGSVSRRVLVERAIVHVPDVLADPEYTYGASQKIGGYRTVLGVPLLREGTLIGVMAMNRRTVRPFTDKQIELLTTFADQAVIAIENVRLFDEVQARTDDLSESLQQQTATADVLKVISRSTFDLQRVLDTLVASAAQLCDAYDASMLMREDESLVFGAHHGPIPLGIVKRRLARTWTNGRAVLDRKPVHVHDLTAEGDEFPEGRADALRLGHRTILSVPLLREDEAIGSLSIRRTEVRPFTNRQIELATTFADQAVIAIENVRLFDEVQARTRELSEALEQQTATAEVLKVISSSPGELQPVFQTMLANAVRICEAKFGVMSLREGDAFRVVATHGPPALVDARQREPLIRPTRGHNLERLVRTKNVVHVPDISADPESAPTLAKFGGAKALVNVPLTKDDELIGSIVIFRQEAGPFSDKQIELVQNLANQAVIAIENTRLLNELRESLQQQTATSEVLRVISSSPGELKLVFQTMLDNAVRICEAKFGILFLYDGDFFDAAALVGAPQAYAEFLQSGPHRFGDTPSGRAARTRQVVYVEDLRIMINGDNAPVRKAIELGGVRTTVCVPMLKENESIGVLTIYRQEVRPFSDKQIELLSNFAKQAVIAIENTRLLNELRESLQQQTATADVLTVISRSRFDVQPVFEAIIKRAAQLCQSVLSAVYRSDGKLVHLVAHDQFSPESAAAVQAAYPVPVTSSNIIAVAVRERRVLHHPDVLASGGYTELQRASGYRSILVVPMLRDDVAIGAIAVMQTEPRLFPETQVTLLETFASQAVIAIDTVRLFNELRQRTDDLTESLQQQTATADVLKVISRSTFDLQTVLDTLVESAARLCEADTVNIGRPEGENYYFEANYGFSREYAEFVANHPPGIDGGTVAGRVLLERKIVHVPDVLADPEYTYVAGQKIGGFRTLLGVPLL
jgi:two-component system, NtrC family, sensor kinase